MRSQNNEEQIIKEYFNGHTGALLDIGANDGKTLSNSYALLQSGWQGCLVEPSAKAFSRLQTLYKNRNDIHLFEYAIGSVNGQVPFFESGQHLNENDTALLSTTNKTQLQRWENTNTVFEETKVQMLTFQSFLERSPIKHFDLISIDAEGTDYEILCQMNLKDLGCRMLIIEWNGKEKEKYFEHAVGYKLLAENQENLIFAL